MRRRSAIGTGEGCGCALRYACGPRRRRRPASVGSRAPCPCQGRWRLSRRHRIAPAHDWQRCRALHRPGGVRVGDRIALSRVARHNGTTAVTWAVRPRHRARASQWLPRQVSHVSPLSVTEVCFAVGCSSLGTFSTRFTELVGVPPSTYRRQAAVAAAGIPSCVAKQVTRPIRNREARVTEPQLA